MRLPFHRRGTLIPLACAGIAIAFAVPAHASAATQFFIDSSYDDAARTQISATHLLDGNHAHFYVEDSFLSALNDTGKNQLSSYVQNLSDDFDASIYPNETYVFGNEWKPGIDNDLKITVLITPMRNSAGGYFRPQDEQLAADSNQREMVYVNAHLMQYPHIHEFLAHEFQHLINYNQKTRLQGFQDEVWLNEMMSEVAPMAAGIYQEPTFSYDKSNIHDRVTTFLASPNDDIVDWSDSVQDYGSIALVGYYLYEHYGVQFFTDLERSDQTGIPALDQALQETGAQKTFAQVVSDWMVADIVNDCNVAPQNLYCYTDSFLNYDNLHIQFRRTQIGDSKVSFQQQADEWAGNWFRYSKAQQDVSDGTESSAATASPLYLNASFSAPVSSVKFLGSYIVYGADGSTRVYPLNFTNSTLQWSVQNFGTDAKQVDVVFGDFFHQQMTSNNPFTTTYALDATLDAKPSGPTLHDGDLMRAQGESKVYVVQGNYKHWIQSAAIFVSYDNLRWEDIKEVSPERAATYQASFLVRKDGDARVFQEDLTGTKRWIVNEKAFFNHGYSWNMIFIINQKEFNALRTGRAITL